MNTVYSEINALDTQDNKGIRFSHAQKWTNTLYEQ